MAERVSAGQRLLDILAAENRFADREETEGRYQEALTFLPPVALDYFKYPAMGLGTGMDFTMGQGTEMF